VNPGTLVRDAAGPTALIEVSRDLGTELIGMQCVSGEQIRVARSAVRRLESDDAHEWRTHEAFRMQHHLDAHRQIIEQGDSMDDIAIDLETLGVNTRPAILSIGAQHFDKRTGKMGGTFYIELIADEALKYGNVDGSTLTWWINRNEALRTSMFPVDKVKGSTKVNAHTALCQFHAWVRKCSLDPMMWAYGDDVQWLKHLFEVAGFTMRPPWARNRVQSVGTALLLAGVKPIDVPSKAHHDAKDEATWAANAVVIAWGDGKAAPKKATPPKSPATTAVKPFDDEDDDEL
jgi:hypothetical protein